MYTYIYIYVCIHIHMYMWIASWLSTCYLMCFAFYSRRSKGTQVSMEVVHRRLWFFWGSPMAYLLVICYVANWKLAMEIVDLPIDSMVIFHSFPVDSMVIFPSYVSHYQRVRKTSVGSYGHMHFRSPRHHLGMSLDPRKRAGKKLAAPSR